MPVFATVTGPAGPKPDQRQPQPADVLAPEPVTRRPEWFVILADAGFDTAEAIRQADDAELLALDGIGPARLQQIREATA